MKTTTYNFDMRIDKDLNVYLMEVAPRDGGNYIPDIIKYATGVDLIECSVKAALGEPIDCDGFGEEKGYWSYYAVHSYTDGILERVCIDPEVEKKIIRGTKRRVLTEGVLLETFTFDEWIRHIEES